jgi:hypothetical protein
MQNKRQHHLQWSNGALFCGDVGELEILVKKEKLDSQYHIQERIYMSMI